jgi:hypothetical protein
MNHPPGVLVAATSSLALAQSAGGDSKEVQSSAFPHTVGSPNIE